MIQAIEKPRVVQLSDSVTIIHGDCRDVLPVECDAVVTDPPYGIGFAAQPTKWQRRAGQKPVRVMTWCMEQARVPEGALVLDPFAGSGSTGVACIRTGRRFIGIERDAGHFATMRSRLENELRQTMLPIGSAK